MHLGRERTLAPQARDGRFKGRLDLPADGAVLDRGDHIVAGWALHGWRRLRGVVITLNGRPHALVSEFHERADVTRRWSDFPTTAGAGWSVTVDLTGVETDEVVVSAYAVLEPRRRPVDGTAPSLGQVRHIGTARCQVRGASGHFHRDAFLAAGFTRVGGVVRTTREVATVELCCDDRPVGLARTTRVLDDSGSAMTRFDSVIEVPTDAASVTLSATAALVGGGTVEITPWTAEVRAPVTPGPDADRCAVVRDRTGERLAALARGATPDGPRVLVATHDLGLGGGQLYLHELMLRLVRRGVRFALTTPRAGVLLDDLEAMGVPVLVTGAAAVHDPEAYEAQVSEIAGWAVQHGCTSVLANTMLAFTGADAGLRLGLPLTWAIHESYPLGQLWTEAYGAGATHPYVVERAQQSLGAARRVVFEAEQTRHLYEEHLAPDAGVVVPYGVDLGEIARFREDVDRDALRAELGLGPDTLALLCLGTIEPRKGQVSLAQAFARSERLRDADVELVLVGSIAGTPATEELRRLLAGLDDVRIRLEPVQPGIHRWYHACDVLVCASDVESLPRTMLEAMAFGRPVASTAVFGIPELVEDGVSGWLCRDRDLGALRGMLERVGSTSAHDLAAMGARAREVATTRHDPAVYERYYLDQLTGVPADTTAGTTASTTAGTTARDGDH